MARLNLDAQSMTMDGDSFAVFIPLEVREEADAYINIDVDDVEVDADGVNMLVTSYEGLDDILPASPTEGDEVKLLSFVYDGTDWRLRTGIKLSV